MGPFASSLFCLADLLPLVSLLPPPAGCEMGRADLPRKRSAIGMMAIGFGGQGAGSWQGLQGGEKEPSQSDSVLLSASLKGDDPEACQIRSAGSERPAGLDREAFLHVCVRVLSLPLEGAKGLSERVDSEAGRLGLSSLHTLSAHRRELPKITFPSLRSRICKRGLLER